MTPRERIQLLGLLVLVAVVIGLAVVTFQSNPPTAAKFLATAGIICGLAAAAQGAIAMKFERVLDFYGDEERFP